MAPFSYAWQAILWCHNMVPFNDAILWHVCTRLYNTLTLPCERVICMKLAHFIYACIYAIYATYMTYMTLHIGDMYTVQCTLLKCIGSGLPRRYVHKRSMQIGGVQWTVPLYSRPALHWTSIHCARVSLLKMCFDICNFLQILIRL